MLFVENLSKSFYGLEVFKNINFQVQQNEAIGLMGPNGAGKTTLVNVLTGELKSSGGVVKLHDKEITNFPSDKIRKIGIARTYQIPRAFSKMSVLENVLVAARFGGKLNAKAAMDMAKESLELVGLYERRQQLARELQFSDLRMLELARASVTNPQLIFIDEVAAGMPDSDLPKILDALSKIRATGKTIIIIEHIIKVLIKIVDRILVLNEGQIILDDTPEKVMGNEKVIEAYLGK